MKNRIDFMIAGVQKAGTTSMHLALRQHPKVRMSRPKEMHYFDRGPHPKSEVDHRSYHARGWGDAGFSEDLLYGESTPKYALALPKGRVPFLPRIRAYNPKIKLIFIFRNPVDRLHSHWWMLRRGVSASRQRARPEPQRSPPGALARRKSLVRPARGYAPIKPVS